MARAIQTNLRTTPELKHKLQIAANSNGTTFNKEANRRLVESFETKTISRVFSTETEGDSIVLTEGSLTVRVNLRARQDADLLMQRIATFIFPSTTGIKRGEGV